MELAVATTNIPYEMPEVFTSLESGIQKYKNDGFVITQNLNIRPDLTFGGVRMEKTYLLCEPSIVHIVLVNVQ